MDKLLDREDTTVTSDPEVTEGNPRSGQFVLTPTPTKPEPKVIIEVPEPRTIMDVVVKAPVNVESVTVVLKRPDGTVIKEVVLPRRPNVC